MSGPVFTQEDQPRLVGGHLGKTEMYRKAARIIAVRIDVPFVVETDRGPMQGHPGDWLVTNHPDDDPGSDLWAISAERMAATYGLVEEPLPGD